MLDAVILRWNKDGRSCDDNALHCMPHMMGLNENEQGFKLMLTVHKKTSQFMSVEVAPGKIDDFLTVWRKTGWNEVDVHHEGKAFFALRYIEFPRGRMIVWRVDHRDDIPHDELHLFGGTVEGMREAYRRNR